MIYRKVTLEDVDDMVDVKKRQLKDEFCPATCNIDKQLKEYYTKAIADGSFVGCVAVDNGKVVANGAIIFQQYAPTYEIPNGIKGYVTNMYTRDEYRGQGIASKILEYLEEYSRERGCTKLWLSASVMGKSVYAKYGFNEHDNHMWLDVK